MSTGDAQALPPNLAGSILILPSVSIGNVGQLAIDLIIETCQAPRIPIRFPAAAALIPCAGTGCYSHIPGTAYSMELFSVPNTNIYIIQQRSPAAPGLQQAFADGVAAWAKAADVAQILTLGSLDGTFRRDDQLHGSQLRFWQEPGSEESLKSAATAAGLVQLEAEWFADKSLEERLLPPWPLLRACRDSEIALPCCAIVAFVMEGDNISDAVRVANAAGAVVPQLAAAVVAMGGGGDSTCDVVWKQPPSWRYAFGGARPAAGF